MGVRACLNRILWGIIMALVIGLNIDIDNRIRVGKTLITVNKIIDKSSAEITINGDFLTENKIINDSSMIRIMDRVNMGIGLNSNKGSFCRVLIEAPKSIKITTGTKL